MAHAGPSELLRPSLTESVLPAREKANQASLLRIFSHAAGLVEWDAMVHFIICVP